VRIKYCGITSIEDAECATDLGAWALGINHWSGSPRRCEPAVATEIGGSFRRKLEIVGVFVNPSLGEVARAAEDHSLSIVQLHGDEGVSFCREVARKTGCRVIKAMRVRSGAEIMAAEAFRVDFHLLDAHSDASPGGTGERFDWELLRNRQSEIPLILAGGLKADNVAEAITLAQPFAVDVASGVESSPGVKDHQAMAEFAEQANAADPAVTA
jgi:phosphoribosylanthranilate isomerase